jgi:hypothetical protein
MLPVFLMAGEIPNMGKDGKIMGKFLGESPINIIIEGSYNVGPPNVM